MDDLKVTLIQSDLHWQSIDANLAMFEEKLWSAAPDSDLVVLPEMFNTGFTMKAPEFAESVNGKSHRWMKKMAEQFNTAITGSLIIKDKNDFFNRLLWVMPDGYSTYYDKRHLFRMSDEQKRFTRGEKLLTMEIKGWKVRPFICYDLRFPVWTRNKIEAGEKKFAYDLSIFVSNWPAARIQAWETLLKTRAIENSSYCIGLNRTGVDGNDTSYNGHSMVCDFKGRSLTVFGEEEFMQSIAISYQRLGEYREKFPVHYDWDNYNIVN